MNSPFSESDRLVFSYHNGKERVFADPLELERKIRFLLGNPGTLVDKINSTDLNSGDTASIREALQAQEKLAIGVREVFQLPDFDTKTGGGMTEAMVFSVWASFCAWLDSKKKSIGILLTTSPPTQASPQPFCPSHSTTAATVASG
jgi:hypothetical protein